MGSVGKFTFWSELPTEPEITHRMCIYPHNARLPTDYFQIASRLCSDEIIALGAAIVIYRARASVFRKKVKLMSRFGRLLASGLSAGGLVLLPVSKPGSNEVLGSESAYCARAESAQAVAGIQTSAENLFPGVENSGVAYGSAIPGEQASVREPTVSKSEPTQSPKSAQSPLPSVYTTAFSGSARKSGGYASYINSLSEYCDRYGYRMPEVRGDDYDSAYFAWKSVYSQWESGRASAPVQSASDSYDIVPIIFGDGSVVFRDLNGHGEVSAMKMPSGFYRLSGPKEMVTAIGGRGEFDTIIRHLSDGNYFNDSKG